jgi:alkaline phosphatase
MEVNMIRGIKSFISIITTVLLLISTMLGFYGTDGTKNEYKTYKNVILMIGDGMGFNTVEAAKSRYGIDELPMETFPVHSQSKTRSASNKITDSAAGATALSCGVRTYNNAVGVYAFAPFAKKFNTPKSLTELAKENGKAAGVVTTDKTSGATPASFSAHSFIRQFEPDISIEQMHSELDLIWGSKSTTVTKLGCKLGGFQYISSAKEMNSLQPGTRSFAQFDMDAFANVTNNNDNPYLADMTKKAIELLNSNENGFFLMVEAAHIDKFSHKNILEGSTAQVIEFNKAIQVAYDFAKQDGDTLVLVTADHETGGITYNEETGEYYYTTKKHTGVNVPIYVSANDTGFITGEAYDNYCISTQLARVMGYDKTQFPKTK